jgi:hypothetical protein
MVGLLAAMTTPVLNMRLGKDTASINNLGINASLGLAACYNEAMTYLIHKA